VSGAVGTARVPFEALSRARAEPRTSPRAVRPLSGFQLLESCLQPSSVLVDLGRVPADPCLSAAFLCYRSPPHCCDGSSSCDQSLLESLTRSRPSDLSAGPAPWVLLPSTASLGRAPYGAGRHTRPGSALRFSQPLSGFLANPSFRALFRALAAPGIPPSESSPRSSRAPLSGPPAPLRSSTDVLDRRRPSLITASFRDARAHAQLPASPADYELPFHTPRGRRFPVTPSSSDGTEPFRPLHPLRSLDPLASPFTPTRVAPSQRPLLSWPSAPPELSPSTPRILGPAQAARA
jgi:hypothetical protein